MAAESSSSPSAARYRSGTAARLAGIPVATLRVWERRYRIVGPQVSARGHRRYAPEDVNRLALIKALVDQGHAIGTLAHLSIETLRQMRDATPGLATVVAPAAAAPAAAPARVAIVGAALAARVAREKSDPRVEVVAHCDERELAPLALRGVQAELLAIELPTLSDTAVTSIDALAAAVGARRAIVAYRFAADPVLRALRARGHTVVRAPLELEDIASLAAEALGRATRQPPVPLGAPPAPRFDERTLARLSQTSSTVKCECPEHVVNLLADLAAFERYSADCENRDPQDAELHRYLMRVAGNARALFEQALERVAEKEGIAL